MDIGGAPVGRQDDSQIRMGRRERSCGPECRGERSACIQHDDVDRLLVGDPHQFPVTRCMADPEATTSEQKRCDLDEAHVASGQEDARWLQRANVAEVGGVTGIVHVGSVALSISMRSPTEMPLRPASPAASSMTERARRAPAVRHGLTPAAILTTVSSRSRKIASIANRMKNMWIELHGRIRMPSPAG